jgi:flagellar hook-associated protein 2
MSSNSSIFAGSSRYANDFQQVIQRTLAIASLPLQQLNSRKIAFNEQAAALAQVDAKFVALQTALDSIGAASSGGNSFAVASSNSSVATAVLAGASLPGTYHVNVLTAGSVTSTMSSDGLVRVTDANTESISSASVYTLTVDGVDFSITPEDTDLVSLAKAINSAAAGVQATVVNVGSPSQPDYRLSVQGDKLAATTIQLNDGTQDLLDTLATGEALTYQVNGQPATPISTDVATVSIAPGVTVDLLQPGTSTITVSRNASGVANSIASFVNAFNAAVDELDKHRGSNKGALSGNSLTSTLAQNLRDIGSYTTDTNALSSLANLGITFDRLGHLVFNQSTFEGTTKTQLAVLADFLGSPETGGFLKVAADAMHSIEDQDDGILQDAIASIKSQIRHQDQLIEDRQRQIDQLEESLNHRMAAADALIASLEQQVTYMSNLFIAMRDNSKNL